VWWGANRLCSVFCVDCVGSLADAHLAGPFVSWGVCGWNMRRRGGSARCWVLRGHLLWVLSCGRVDGDLS